MPATNNTSMVLALFSRESDLTLFTEAIKSPNMLPIFGADHLQSKKKVLVAKGFSQGLYAGKDFSDLNRKSLMSLSSLIQPTGFLTIQVNAELGDAVKKNLRLAGFEAPEKVSEGHYTCKKRIFKKKSKKPVAKKTGKIHEAI